MVESINRTSVLENLIIMIKIPFTMIIKHPMTIIVYGTHTNEANLTLRLRLLRIQNQRHWIPDCNHFYIQQPSLRMRMLGYLKL